MLRYVLILFLLAGSNALAQPTQPTEAEQERRSEKARIEAEVSQLPVLHANSVEQAARLSVEYDMLEARTSLDAHARESRVELPGLKGVVRITFFGPRPAEGAGGNYFDLLQQDLTDPSIGQVYTRVSCYAGRVNITRDIETAEWMTSIQLLQDPPSAPGVPIEELPVRLYIQQTHVEDKLPELRQKFEDESFMQLRLHHIAEMDRYVRPILRDLHQERALFAIPPATAWVALAEDPAPDPKLVERMKPMIDRLDSEDYQARVKARQELENLGPAALAALGKIKTSDFSAQQRNEIALLLEESTPEARKELRELSGNVSFVLDVLYNADPELQKAALAQLAKLTGRVVSLPSTSPQDRDAAIAKLRDELLPPATQRAQ